MPPDNEPIQATPTPLKETKPTRSPADYRGRLKPIWCAGCGNYGVLSAMIQALADLDIDPDYLAVVSGIGCSSRLPGFLRAYGFHGVHGRALPTAVGVKLGNPHLNVLAVGGDGDGMSIGAGHFPHVARRNIDITYLMLDNRIYGLTKGQTSPTTPHGLQTKTSPQGVIETPIDPIAFAVTFGATFVARGYSAQASQVRELIRLAIQHRGFSLVHIISPCVTFGRGIGYDYFNECIKPLPENHDPKDLCQAILKSRLDGDIFTGIFYDIERPEFVSEMQARGGARGRELDDSDPKIDVEALIARFS